MVGSLFAIYYDMCINACYAVINNNCYVGRGEKFRADFARLTALISVPLMALTASAPLHIQAAIVTSLQLNNPVYVNGNLDRLNIYLSANPITSMTVSVPILCCVVLNTDSHNYREI